MFVNFTNGSYTATMYDRDEVLRARIDNYLGERHARIKRVATATGMIALRQATQSDMIVGSFAASKKDYKRRDRDYFIESTPDEDGIARQLWLPAYKSFGAGALRQREVVATAAHPSERFEAWQAVQPLVGDLEGYSEYEGEGQALFEETKLSLQYIDANNGDFRISISTVKF